MITGNEPAMPLSIVCDPQGDIYSNTVLHESGLGLTIRQYFAAMAMQGILSNNITYNSTVVKASVEVADALIKQLNKTQ